MPAACHRDADPLAGDPVNEGHLQQAGHEDRDVDRRGDLILKQRHDCPLARRDKPGGVDPTSRVNGFPDDGLFAEGGIGEGGVAVDVSEIHHLLIVDRQHEVIVAFHGRQGVFHLFP